MCGICGIVRPNRTEIDRPCLEAMNAAIRHRGPDSDGFFIEAGVGLGSRRLAIIDLTTGDQPIANEDGSVWVVMNGEIFNFPELRPDLEYKGHRFSTNTDTECLVHLYEEYGADLVRHLRGQFAFALWDQRLQRLVTGRDRMGQKPLFYTEHNGALYFSSELPSLLEGLSFRPEIDRAAIDLYLSLQYIPEPRTPFHGIYKLPAAHTLVWQGGSQAMRGNLTIERYWEYSYEPKLPISEAQAVDELRALLDEAVRIRLLSDVPLGAHLSGGIDSSIVVALMSRHSQQPVKTFSVGFEEDDFSELRYARAVVERYRTDHHEFNLRFDHLPDLIEKVVGHFGEPFADPSALPLYQLSMLTREYVTVALNGDGGDEAFAGYQRYWLDRWANRYTRLPVWLTEDALPGLVDWLPDRSDKPTGGSLVNGLKRLRQVSQIDRRASILRWGSYFSPLQKANLWRQPPADQAEAFLVEHYENASARSYLDRTLWTDIHTYLPGDLLVKADRMTMAASLEGRSPFLDHKLVEWAARLPEDYRLRGRTGKYILRKAFEKELPPEVLQRGKQGFGIPVGTWFRGPLADWADDLLLSGDGTAARWFNHDYLANLLGEHTRGARDHGKRIYALASLAIWLRRFVDR